VLILGFYKKKMEMKGEKENIQDKKGKLECSKYSPKPKAPRGSNTRELSHA